MPEQVMPISIMETKPAYVAVGGFILFVLGIAFYVILWFGSGKTEYDEYVIVFEEQVSGLNRGGAVRFSGIQVGEVRALEINENGLVEATVRVDKTTPVKTDTVASLEIVGFTGLAIIQFEGGSPTAEWLRDTVPGNDPPVLFAQQSGIGLLLSESSSIVEAANKVLSQKNIDNISGIIEDFHTLTGVLVDSRDDISLILANAAQITEDLARASDDLDRLVINLDKLAQAEGKQALANVTEVAEDAQKLIAELQILVEENRENIKGFTGTGLAQIGPGMTELRRLLRTADGFMRQLERDPRGYLLGESIPEYEAAQ